jgi:putative ABC transport system substrate-binding protein
LRATLLRLVGPHPNLDGAFAKIRQEYTQAIVALEHPAIGANARKIAERACALNIPSIFARDQAGSGGLFGYGTSLGGAAHVMARAVSRVLGGDAAIDIPIESFCSPELVADMATARDLGLTVPPAILRNAVRVN